MYKISRYFWKLWKIVFDNVWLDGIASFWNAVTSATIQLNLETSECDLK